MEEIKKKSIEATIAEISTDNSLPPEVKLNVITALQNASAPLQSDVWIYRLVVCFLGIVVVFTILGGVAIVLTGQTKPLPEGIVAIGSAAIGALAGLLAPSPVKR